MLFLVLQEQQSTSGLTSQAGKYWIAREIVSLMLKGLSILFCSVYQHNQEAAWGGGRGWKRAPSSLPLPKITVLKALRMLISIGVCEKENAELSRTEMKVCVRPGLQRVESNSDGNVFTWCHALHFSASSKLSKAVTHLRCFPWDSLHRFTGRIFILKYS